MQFGTEYWRFKSFQNTGHFIKGRDYVIGDKLKNILLQDRVIQDRAAVKAQFVPMGDVLKQFFMLDGIFSETME